MSKACPVCGWKTIGNAEETVCPECGHELEYTRSGLFMEQIRIIKEMRQNERNHGRAGLLVRPRYCIWENVPGAFSSNDGKDFQAVLTEFVKVCEPDAPDVPMPEKGKWPKAGCIFDELGGWSIAYRLHDAQYWGVPQRRKRACVLADFNGLTAAELLFDPQYRRDPEESESDETERNPGRGGREVSVISESLPGNPEQSGASGQGTAAGTESGSGSTISFQERAGKPGGGAKESSFSVSTQEHSRPSTTKPCAAAGFKHKASPAAGGGYEEEKVPSLMAGQESAVCYAISSFDSNAMKSPNPNSGIYKAETARTLDLNGGSPACNQGGGGGRDSRGLPERDRKPGSQRDAASKGQRRYEPEFE